MSTDQRVALRKRRGTVTSNRRAGALEGLNKEQRLAVTQPPGVLLVLAGAGAGKTRVLTRRAAWLIETRQVEPAAILAITLTNKAAGEMIGRLRHLCGEEAARQMQVSTFHAMCARLLRSHPALIARSAHFQIYDSDEARAVIERSLTAAERTIIGAKQVLGEISAAKHHYVSLDDYEAFAADEASGIVARAWRGYEQELRRADALDFTDLLARAVDLLREHPDVRAAVLRLYRTVLVDEYQDSNPTQARLLRLLVDHDFYAVGDDKQVIYGFRLADVRLILDFEQEYRNAKVLTLQTNYRCTVRIVEAANNLIARNQMQRPMRLVPKPGAEEGLPVHVHASASDAEESQWITSRIQRFIEQGVKESEIAVLARQRRIVERVERALAGAGVSYTTIGFSGFFARTEVRVALAHLRLIVNPRNQEMLVTALGIRPKVAAATIAKIVAYAEAHEMTMLEACAAVDLIAGVSGVARENVRCFAYEMLAFVRQSRSMPVSELTHAVIRMRNGVADTLSGSAEDDQRFERLQALYQAACTYERQADEPTLAGWLQDAALAGRDDLAGPNSQTGRVSLGTIHLVKGLEWPIVIAAGFDRHVIPSRWAKSKAEIEEERRMGYVVITRATRLLIFSYANYRDGRPSGPSRFIPESLTAPGQDAPGQQTRGARELSV